jgi:predicted ATPase/class 3 adenylate cyclase
MVNPSGSKFCNECAQNLTITASVPALKELSFDEKLDKIRRYLPNGLIDKILSQRDRIEGERKLVTVMFCDMEGFTALSEKLGPEEAYSIMDEVYEILIHKVHDYEGTVNEMTGDGIMALFGAPIALEDAPQRAIRSAYSIHREMARFSDKIKQERQSIPPLKMRIGIHTGSVVVGTLGNDLRVEFKAVGDTVNVASRMEGLAQPGSTYVSGETFKLTEGLFRYESLGEKEAKGKQEPVAVYRVIGPSMQRTRFDVSAERGLTPFVGRARELELLLDGFERAKEGRGQAFSITAEAGVGKSRLLYEFRKAVSNENVTFLEGKCLSYRRGVTYHPIIDILRSNFDVRDENTDVEIRQKVRNGLKVLGVDETSILPYLLELLGVKDSGIDKITMSPEARKARMIDALKQIAFKGSEIRPLIIAYEDLHWIDKGSEDVLKISLESIPGARVLLLFTYRPDYLLTWGARSYHNQVNLNRLSNRESLIMASHLLGTEALDGGLENLILEKAEGIPFFIEEFVRSLKDLNLIERNNGTFSLIRNFQDMTVPSTIQDIIMSRVDSLPEDAKELLQTASVIEREFNYELIKRVTSLSEQALLSNLSFIKDAELIYERGIYPETTYIFKHALTREVVYDSLLSKKKKLLHAEISKTIEELYNENPGEHCGILADHFIESENFEKAANYTKMAGRRAEKAADLNDAIVYAEKCVNCLERLPKTDEVQKKIIDARTVLGLYLAQMNYLVEAKAAIDPVCELALKTDYKKRLAQIYTIIGTYYYLVEEDLPRTFKILEDALTISEEINDIVSLVFSSYWLSAAQSTSCDFEKAYHNLKTALDINVAANNLWGIAVMKSHLSRSYYFYKGQIERAYQISNEAIRIAEESSDTYSKTISYTSHGLICMGKGFIEEAKDSLMKGLNFGERINYFSWEALSHWGLGETYFEKGEYQYAIDHHSKAILLLEDSRWGPSLASLSKISLVKSKVRNNEEDIDLDLLRKLAAENKYNSIEGNMQRFIAEILLNKGDQHTSDAKDSIEKAIEADKKNGLMFYLGLDYALYAEVLKRNGDQLTAKEILGRAIEILKECGADGWVEKYEKELTASL